MCVVLFCNVFANCLNHVSFTGSNNKVTQLWLGIWRNGLHVCWCLLVRPLKLPAVAGSNPGGDAKKVLIYVQWFYIFTCLTKCRTPFMKVATLYIQYDQAPTLKRANSYMNKWKMPKSLCSAKIFPEAEI